MLVRGIRRDARGRREGETLAVLGLDGELSGEGALPASGEGRAVGRSRGRARALVRPGKLLLLLDHRPLLGGGDGGPVVAQDVLLLLVVRVRGRVLPVGLLLRSGEDGVDLGRAEGDGDDDVWESDRHDAGDGVEGTGRCKCKCKTDAAVCARTLFPALACHAAAPTVSRLQAESYCG